MREGEGGREEEREEKREERRKIWCIIKGENAHSHNYFPTHNTHSILYHDGMNLTTQIMNGVM